LKHNLTCNWNWVRNICVACLVFQLLKLIAQLIVLSKLFLNEPPFYGSANIFETQDAMEWPTKKFGNTASVLAS
jgi:hypothetical protein